MHIPPTHHHHQKKPTTKQQNCQRTFQRRNQFIQHRKIPAYHTRRKMIDWIPFLSPLHVRRNRRREEAKEKGGGKGENGTSVFLLIITLSLINFFPFPCLLASCSFIHSLCLYLLLLCSIPSKHTPRRYPLDTYSVHGGKKNASAAWHWHGFRSE